MWQNRGFCASDDDDDDDNDDDTRYLSEDVMQPIFFINLSSACSFVLSFVPSFVR